jgi:hypothetical protein
MDADGPRRIGRPDVDRLRAMRLTFDRLDSMFGGAHARDALVQHLRTELPRLLRASACTSVREAAVSAAGEMTQLAAWMSYDAGLHGLAPSATSSKHSALPTSAMTGYWPRAFSTR